MNVKITASDARELFESLGARGELMPEGASVSVGPWRRAGSQKEDDGRWSAWYLLIVQDEQGITWGLSYGLGLTEYQDHDLPWESEEEDELLALAGLHPHEVTRIEYQTCTFE